MTSKLRFRLLAGALALLALSARAEAPFSFDATPGQLPKNVVPESYALHLAPDVQAKTFRASVTIKITVLAPTRRIVMNALNLKIARATLTATGGVQQQLDPVIDADKQTLTFNTPAQLQPGAYDLLIDYYGVINAEPQGLFFDKYPSPKGEKILLGTQMEPTDARRLLPCWDEPVFRATFKLFVDLPAQYTQFSNTPAEKVDITNGIKHVEFATTPKMASYLLVLVAGEMERLDTVVLGTRTTVAAVEGRRPGMDYPLKITGQLLGFYNDYFGIRFPLPKLDQLAIPGGFPGAMENWGGITYNETALLYDPAKSTESRKREVFETTAHEMAHQWFGDLVTMAWWDNLWLNEGFASWMGTKATDHFNPEWKCWLTANSDRERAMALDARKTTHPIQQPVANESEANDAFDNITYLKGQSFIRMLETYLGEDVFRAGIREYMQAHQYGSTTTADLWAALEKVSGKPVARLATAWTTQPGFPLLTVDAGACKDGARSVKLTQDHFTVDGSSDPKRLWPVPVTLATGAARTTALLDGASGTTSIADCRSVLVADPEGSAYYRVAYSPATQVEIAALLPTLPPAVRLKLLSDTWALVAAGRYDARVWFDLVARLGDEQEFAVWDQIATRLDFLDRLTANTAAQTRLREYGIALLRKPLAKLGWDERPSDTSDMRRLRIRLIETLGELDDGPTVAEAQRRFTAFSVTPTSLAPALRPTVLAIAGAHADDKVYARLSQLAAAAITTEDRELYYEALWSARDPALARRSLDAAIEPDAPQFVAERAVGAVANDGRQRTLAWGFAKAHAEALLKRIASFGRNGYLGYIVSQSTDAIDADELEALSAKVLPADSQTESHRTADGIRNRAQIRSRVVPQIEVVLSAR